jgi:hypothetical protein
LNLKRPSLKRAITAPLPETEAALFSMDMANISASLHAAALLLLAAGCSSPKSAPAPAQPRPQILPDAFWRGDGVSGAPSMVIDLSSQRLRYYKGGELVGQSPISTGSLGRGTPTGSFKVTQKDLNHRSSHYGSYVSSSGAVVVDDVDARKDPKPPGTRFLGAGMRYFMRFNGPIGMHEGYLPGYPASHGCVRLPTQMAAIFYAETPHGTPVRVVGHASNAGRQPVIPVGWGRLARDGESAEPAAAAATAPATPGRAAPSGRKRGRAEEVRRALNPAPPPTLRRGQTWYLE